MASTPAGTGAPLPFWIVDAFTPTRYAGNPAAVVVLRAPLDDVRMLAITREFNQSETAFVLLRGEAGANPLLRWFTTTGEIDLCGHATLASAHVVLSELARGAPCDMPLLDAICVLGGGDMSMAAHARATCADMDAAVRTVRAAVSGTVPDIPDVICMGTGWETCVRAGSFDALDAVCQQVTFATLFAGDLAVRRVATHPTACYAMDLPARPGVQTPLDALSPHVLQAVGAARTPPVSAWVARDVMLVYDSADAIHEMEVDVLALNRQERFICVTARAPADAPWDFVSRFFCPLDALVEDPVTGSAHCTLTPFWADELGRDALTARQVSQRGGTLHVTYMRERKQVVVAGAAVTAMDGHMR